MVLENKGNNKQVAGISPIFLFLRGEFSCVVAKHFSRSKIQSYSNVFYIFYYGQLEFLVT